MIFHKFIFGCVSVHSVSVRMLYIHLFIDVSLDDRGL